MSNKNAMTIMKVEEVDWAQILFKNLCSELDRWTKMDEKMQTWVKQKDNKKIYHSTLVLEILFMYIFQEDFKVITKNKKNFKKIQEF
jgi:hypothetical protein